MRRKRTLRGATYERPIEEGGGTNVHFPFDSGATGISKASGPDINIEFVDRSMSGEYGMTWIPPRKKTRCCTSRRGA